MGSIAMLGLRAVLFVFILSIVLQQIHGKDLLTACTKDTESTTCEPATTGLTCTGGATATPPAPNTLCACDPPNVYDAAKTPKVCDKKADAPPTDTKNDTNTGSSDAVSGADTVAATVQFAVTSLGVMGIIKMLTVAHC